MSGFINASKPFADFGDKAERFLAQQYPSTVDNYIRSISIGRNKDAAPGQRGGFRVSGAASQAGGSYLEVPDRIIGVDKIKNAQEAGIETFTTRVSDSAKALIIEAKQRLMDKGMTEEQAEKRVRDSMQILAYYDAKTRKYVAEAMPGRVKDAIIPGLAVPYWNVSYTTKVFKQPFIKGLSRNLVNIMGVPNIWADVLVMYAESFEGFARMSSVAKSNGEFNDSAPVRSQFDMIASDFVNLVVDYETTLNEQMVAQQNGNFLTPMAVGDRERYARLMLEQLHNALILFGDTASGFNGLTQIAGETSFAGTPLSTIWSGVGTSKGADAIKSFLTLIGNMQEALNFLPSAIKINMSPTAYKVFKWTMQSDVYSSKNPLQILAEDFKDHSMVVGVDAENFGKGIDSFQIVSDPLCAANTPWNAANSDLTFITFPSIKSALDPQEDVVIAPVAIENFLLPNFPQRDGLQRTMLKRVGGVIAPITGTIQVIRGFGAQ